MSKRRTEQKKGIIRAVFALAAFLLGAAGILGARVTADEAAEKWSRRLGAAGEDIRRGIERVQVAPGQAAVAQEAKMRAKTLEAIDSGKWRERTGAVTLTEWRSAAINKGLPRVAAGASEAQPKMRNFMAELLPFVDSARAEIAAMPSLTLDDSIARMTKFTRKMATFKRSR